MARDGTIASTGDDSARDKQKDYWLGGRRIVDDSFEASFRPASLLYKYTRPALLQKRIKTLARIREKL